MSTRPEPPHSAENPEALVQHVRDQPLDWLLYLRNINAYLSSVEDELSAAQKAVALSHENLTRVSRQVDDQYAIIQFQKATYQEEIDRITAKWIKAETEKERAISIGSPAVATPASPPISAPVAEGNVDTPKGTPTPAYAVSSEPSRISERLPDPKEFDGNRSDLRRFVQQIHAKMTTNSDRFPTAQSRLAYVSGRLSGRAYELILPKIQYGIPQFMDYSEMLRHLESAFGDPDRVQNAQNELYRLRQKNLDFSVFLAEFQRLALEGEMPDTGLTPLLTQSISRELQDMLLHNPARSRNFEEYARHLQELDNRYRQHQQQTARSRNTSSAVTLPRPNAPIVPYKTTPSASQRPTTVAVTTQVRSSEPEPMDLSRQNRPSRKETGACYRCGSLGHRVRDCPHPDTRPGALRSQQSSPAGSPRKPSSRGRSPPSPRSESSPTGVSVKGMSLGSVATRL